jgi:hypothetical protein
MRRTLTRQQRQRLRDTIRELVQSGATRHTGLLGEQSPSWGDLDWVIATDADLTHTGITRPCADCGEDAYTSIHYPATVAIVCETCSYDRLVGKEAAHA